MTTYSEVADLLVGDVTIGGGIDRDKFVQSATEEIDSRLGFIYVLPLTPSPSSHIALLLKRCANLIASGRLFMAIAAGSEDNAVHAYGESLLREGQSILESIACGQVDLGVTKVTVQSEGNAPSITNVDDGSPFDAFYNFVTPGNFPTPLVSTPVYRPVSS